MKELCEKLKEKFDEKDLEFRVGATNSDKTMGLALAYGINNEWISKEDGANVTEFESVKGGISNAFKRVASSGFGIGRYLYNARNSWYPIKKQGNGYIFAEIPKLQLNEEKKIK